MMHFLVDIVILYYNFHNSAIRNGDFDARAVSDILVIYTEQVITVPSEN